MITATAAATKFTVQLSPDFEVEFEIVDDSGTPKLRQTANGQRIRDIHAAGSIFEVTASPLPEFYQSS